MNSLVHAWRPWFSNSRLSPVRLFDARVRFRLVACSGTVPMRPIRSTVGGAGGLYPDS
jgi:hypothetical protein